MPTQFIGTAPSQWEPYMQFYQAGIQRRQQELAQRSMGGGGGGGGGGSNEPPGGPVARWKAEDLAKEQFAQMMELKEKEANDAYRAQLAAQQQKQAALVQEGPYAGMPIDKAAELAQKQQKQVQDMAFEREKFELDKWVKTQPKLAKPVAPKIQRVGNQIYQWDDSAQKWSPASGLPALPAVDKTTPKLVWNPTSNGYEWIFPDGRPSVPVVLSGSQAGTAPSQGNWLMNWLRGQAEEAAQGE